MTATGVWRAADDPLIRAAIRLREIPTRLLGRGRRRSLERDDFTVLERREDMALVYGLIGAFGRADDGLCAIPSTEAFLSRHDDVCTLALGFIVRPGSGTPTDW